MRSYGNDGCWSSAIGPVEALAPADRDEAALRPGHERDGQQ
jgi:hypothetical protein